MEVHLLYLLLPGKTKFSTTPNKADKPIPAIVNPPNSNAAPPIPNVNIRETSIRLRVSPRLIRFCIRLFIPIQLVGST